MVLVLSSKSCNLRHFNTCFVQPLLFTSESPFHAMNFNYAYFLIRSQSLFVFFLLMSAPSNCTISLIAQDCSGGWFEISLTVKWI